jgi:hypothetical protein
MVKLHGLQLGVLREGFEIRGLGSKVWALGLRLSVECSVLWFMVTQAVPPDNPSGS